MITSLALQCNMYSLFVKSFIFLYTCFFIIIAALLLHCPFFLVYVCVCVCVCVCVGITFYSFRSSFPLDKILQPQVLTLLLHVHHVMDSEIVLQKKVGSKMSTAYCTYVLKN